jgi:transcriptional regulator with XRE-family HTH domain
MLKQLRTEAGVTLDAAAQVLECSRQKLWRIEAGAGPTRSPDVKALCELYEVTPEVAEGLIGLAAETRSKGWWHTYGDAIPDWFELYVTLEAAASRIRRYDEALVPGLLQTRGYARAVYQHRVEVTAEERERLVEIRMRRQVLLTRRLPPPPRMDVVLHEAALLRTVGDPATMAEQLRYLLVVAQQPRTSVRVLPLAAGLHTGVEAGTFVMLEFPRGNRTTTEPPVVYSESWTGALYLDRPAEFAAYEKIWAGLDKIALDERQSQHLIAKVAEEVHHG